MIALILISGISVVSLQDNTFESMNDADVSTTVFEGVETCCTDGIDNDGDGLVDNEDGDCWIRDGAVFVENYYMTTFDEYLEIIPELKETGIKTIEMLPIWEHCTSDEPPQRWAVRNFSNIDPMRGDEEELKEFIDGAHSYGIKVLTCMVETGSAVPPCPDCGGYYDKDELGGVLYRHQIENPNKEILLCDENGKFICGIGVQYAVNWSSQDVIEFFKDEYRRLQDYGFDGERLDAPCELTCREEENVYSWMCGWGIVCHSCEGIPCPYPVDAKYSPMIYYRELAKIKNPDEVLIGEAPSTESAKSNWFCSFPYYPPDTMVDEVAEVSESISFPFLLPHLVESEISSSEFIDWINNEPVSYNRQRFRFISTWTRLVEGIANFIVNDPQYFPMVVLISTIPGIPKVTHYELYGNETVDEYHGIDGSSVETSEIRRNHWKNVLGFRNQDPALKYGTIENVWKSGDTTYAYSREYDDEKVIVAINYLDKQATSTLNLSFLDDGTFLYDGLNNETFMVHNPSNFEISIPAYGSRILFLKEGDKPIIYFEKPKEGYLYIADREIMPILIDNTIVIGEITVEADAYDENGIEKVEFCIDDVLKSNDDVEPYRWLWNEFAVGRHELKVIVYDNGGNTATDEIEVIIFNIGE